MYIVVTGFISQQFLNLKRHKDNSVQNLKKKKKSNRKSVGTPPPPHFIKGEGAGVFLNLPKKMGSEFPIKRKRLGK